MNELDELELKPCPFCGGEALLIQSDIDGMSYVTCNRCLCKTADVYYYAVDCPNEKAAEKWNKRVENDKVD